jgi:Leucine-rich repeat (LRR) protein
MNPTNQPSPVPALHRNNPLHLALLSTALCLTAGLLLLAGVPEAEAEQLHISRAGTNVLVAWDQPTNRFVLGSYSVLPGPVSCYYSHAGAVTSAIEVPATNPAGFFRLYPGLRKVEVPDPNLAAALRVYLVPKLSPIDAIYDLELAPLTSLCSIGTGISSLTGLESCPSLHQLEVSGNQICDIGVLSNLTALAWLNLSRNVCVADAGPLAGLTNLTELYLVSDQISDVTPLANLTKLTELYLQQNPITNITAVSGLTNLTTLYLQSSPITDANPLSNLWQLRDLLFADMPATNISAIGELTNLTVLNLNFTHAPDIGPLYKLTNMWWFSLIDIGTTDISAVSNMTKLDTLECSVNQISDLTPLRNLVNLPYLYLNWNQISNITALSGLYNLRSLGLSGNQITDLLPCAGLTNLTSLYLEFNQISDLTPLLTNALRGGLGFGDKVWLQNNPLSEFAQTNQIPFLRSNGVVVYWP